MNAGTGARPFSTPTSRTPKHIVRDLPATHREAYAQFHRSPCLMANIAVRNWRFMHRMGISGCRWFGGLGDYLSVRKMATIGGQPATFGPDSPTVLTIKVLLAGHEQEAQRRTGRVDRALFASFAVLPVHRQGNSSLVGASLSFVQRLFPCGSITLQVPNVRRASDPAASPSTAAARRFRSRRGRDRR